jgi:hypothetical protein
MPVRSQRGTPGTRDVHKHVETRPSPRTGGIQGTSLPCVPNCPNTVMVVVPIPESR